MRDFLYVLIVMGAYFLGSFNLAYWAGKWSKGLDLRQVRSGNLGTVNVYRVVGKRIGVAVFFADCGKEAAAILVLRLLGADLAWQAAAGLSVIIGHNWPIFLGFQGGRGMSMTLTGTLILLPWEGLVMVGLLTLGGATHHTPEFNLMALFLTPILAWRLGRPLSLVLFTLGLLLVGVLRRLQGSPGLEGGEEEGDKKPLLWNRLIYDRESK
ncbi:MAG: glycerol-3-phosphate acyltransferase [Actinomycetota bacterium]|nr:glycerol-3-phosphate acyltransferase [Actinomycetota bacterium]